MELEKIELIELKETEHEGLNLKQIINDIVNNPEDIQKDGKHFLPGPGELVNNNTEHKFKIWKTVNLGTIKTVKDLRRILNVNKIMLSQWVLDILGKNAFTMVTKETKIDLVMVTVGELGFLEGAQLSQIYDRAKKFGLNPCLSEVGFKLRTQYLDQPNGEKVFVAMEPIIVSGYHPDVFCVECSAFTMWLRSSWHTPDYVWPPDSQWVFCPSPVSK